MARYRIDKLAELARQLEFTPHATRLGQLNAAEELLHAIDPDKAYPLEFVIFRTTGYHPRDLSAELLAGEALQHDLGLLIEQISATLDLSVVAMPEPVLSVDEVSERFNVTVKTVQRWRRRGLPARRVVFADGRRRIGFLVSSVERFFAAHRDQVARGTNFSQLNDEEREEIVRRARRLAEDGGCCPREIARRIARKLNRSPLTVLHALRKYDQEHPADAIFPSSAQPIAEAERQRIRRAMQRGIGLSELARRLGRPRASIYRAILDERIERLTSRKIRFIDDSLYHQEDAASIIEQIASQEELSGWSRPEDNRMPRDLPAELQELYRTPLLSPSRERALFLKFNFHKFQFVTARRQLEPELARRRDVEALEHCLAAAIDTKNQILRANQRLVVSVARRHLRRDISLMELISEGNIALMRAVEGFDIHRGHKFSTYATFALMKAFARGVPDLLRRTGLGGTDQRILESLPDRNGDTPAQRMADREQLGRLMSVLSERERRVVCAHFGLERDASATLEQLGRRMGLSKHRVRQIEQGALAKLRHAAKASQV